MEYGYRVVRALLLNCFCVHHVIVRTVQLSVPSPLTDFRLLLLPLLLHISINHRVVVRPRNE